MTARNCFKRKKTATSWFPKTGFCPRLEVLEDRTIPSVTNVWSATGISDHNWNTGTNWSRGHAPMLGEIATFNSSSLENCTINAGVNRCDGINIASTYTGTITAAADLSLVTSAGYTQAGGTFNQSSFAIHDQGNWTRMVGAGGVFNAGTGTVDFSLTVGGSVTVQQEINAGDPFFN